MKKLIVSLLASLGFVVASYGASTTFDIPAGSITNAPLILTNAQCVLLSAQLQSVGNVSPTIQIVDNYTNTLTQTFGAYSNITYSVTNWCNLWTNYYGYTNRVTNFALVTITNSVAGATVSLPYIYSWQAPTNSTISFTGLNQRFNDGIVVTNSGVGTARLTVTYTQ